MQGKLSAARARTLKTPGRYADGGTLYLNVSPGGSKQWVQRLAIRGKRHDIGLGGYPLVSLAEAREAAFLNRKLARAGGDPLAEKRKAKQRDSMLTFGEAAEMTYKALRPRWRNAKVAANWMQQLERHAFTLIGNTPVDRIGREDVLAVLTPIWSTKPETARRVRRCIRATLTWCQAHGMVQFNAAGETIDGALPRMPAVKAHLRALPYREIPAALNTLEASNSSLAAKLTLRFIILTAARPGEARGATWDEIDLEERVWRIPGERMKAGAEHRVPLNDPASDLLNQARPLEDGSGLVFPSPVRRRRPMSPQALTRVMGAIGLAERATVHGFRSSFRDWCAETGKPREIAEAALAHKVGGVEGAYFRSDLFQRRRRLMDEWAAYLIGADAGVVAWDG